MSRSIVLLYPRFEPDFPDPYKRTGPPLAPLTVARPLVKAGYKVEIIDENATPRAIDRMRACETPLYVGISCLGGNTVKTGRRMANWARRLWPDVPIIWGGWSPTLMPHIFEDPGASKWADIIVRGRGEAQALEIAKRLESGESLEGIPGVSWREGKGQMKSNKDAPFDDPTHAELLPYNLLDSNEPYTTKYGITSYISSYGCPHRCHFCGIPIGTRTFKPTANDHVTNHLLHFKQMGMKEIIFFDDNFFTIKERVVDMAQRMIDANVDLKWHCNGRIDQILRLDEEEMAIVAKSGWKSVNVGYETNDQEVADSVSKDYHTDDIYKLAHLLSKHGVGLSVNFMVGLPGETPESLVGSLESLKQIHAIQPDMVVSWYIFMPSPGTPLWHDLVKQGLMKHHQTFNEHAAFDTIFMEHPWYFWGPPSSMWQEWRRKHQAIVWYFWMAYAAPVPSNPVTRWMFHKMRDWCRFRYEKRLFRLRLDWRIAYHYHWLEVHTRWFFKGLSRIRPFWDIYRAFRKLRPVKVPDELGVAGIPKSI
ncbi:MAG: B12-binding domain-containing radical SAM protein [Planctomycetota bacterium]|jgi:radical SAM superfamily enzyme YgiQ (UPF0313 family)